MRIIDLDKFLLDLWNEPCDVNDLSSNWSKSTFGYSYELIERVAEKQDIVEKE
jgi:hypothetical protein